MPAVSRHWTRAEVLDLIERNPLATPRYELVDGVLLVTPSPAYMHQRAVSRLLFLLTAYLDTEPGIGEASTSPSDAELEPGQVTQADVFVVPIDEAKRLQHTHTIHTIIFAAEVLSPRDPSGDRTRKRALYQRTIPEYWIVNSDDRQIEVWRPGVAAPVVCRERAEWSPVGATKPFVLDVAEYFSIVHGERL